MANKWRGTGRVFIASVDSEILDMATDVPIVADADGVGPMTPLGGVSDVVIDSAMSKYCRQAGVPAAECDARYCDESCRDRVPRTHACGDCGLPNPGPDHDCSDEPWTGRGLMTAYAHEIKAEVTTPDGTVQLKRVVSMTVNDGAVLTITHLLPTHAEQIILYAPGAWSSCRTV